MDQLRFLADRVGVGYSGLEVEMLRQKIVLSGAPRLD